MDTNMNMNMGGIIYPITEYTEDQQQSITQQSNAWMYNPLVSGYEIQTPNVWTAPAPIYQQPPQHLRFPAPPQSSFISDLRSSNSSDISHWQRSSMASTNSSWSNTSEQAYNPRRPSIDTPMHIESPISSSHAASPDEEAVSLLPPRSKRKTKQREFTSEKDPFATCVSRTRRTRRSQREPKYWCTSCEEPFIEKYDWKRHEETYQERRFAFRCGLCSAIYFLEKDFLYHHETRHHCETCQRDGHLEAAKENREARTGWGCGFCMHFSTNWRDRCNHIAQHFEKDSRTMEDWRQSNVIQSLLQRPAVRAEWCKILQSQPQLKADFGWNHRNTGRVEGYPENGATPHLQDRLEYYKFGDNAAALAQLAFSMIASPSQPPQAPRKDYKEHHTVTLQSLMDQPEAWSRLISTLPENDFAPTDVSEADYSMLNTPFGEDTRVYY